MPSLLPADAPDMPDVLTLEWLTTDPRPPHPWDLDRFHRDVTGAPGLTPHGTTRPPKVLYPGPARFAVESVLPLGVMARRELVVRDKRDGSHMIHEPFTQLVDTWDSGPARLLAREWPYGRGDVGRWARAVEHAAAVRSDPAATRNGRRHAYEAAAALEQPAHAEYARVRDAAYEWGAQAAEAVEMRRSLRHYSQPRRVLPVQLRPVEPKRKRAK